MLATIPPEAEATIVGMIGSSQAADMLEIFCPWTNKLLL